MKEMFRLSFAITPSPGNFVRKNVVLFFRTKFYGFAKNRTTSCDIARLLWCENDVKLRMACTVVSSLGSLQGGGGEKGK